MITPNKVVSIPNSIIGRMVHILKANPASDSLVDLYRSAEAQFDSIDEFILALDVLYVLGRLDVDTATGMVTHAA